MPQVTLTVNGGRWAGDVREGASVLEVVRERMQLTGAKAGCGEGQCGSCSVLVNRRPVRSCVTPVVEGQVIETVEGLGRDGHLHPVQQAFLDHQAFQCGFCTPGMIMGAVALLARTPRPTDDQVRTALDGHLCRCGTYPRIVAAVQAAGAAMAREPRRD